MNASEKAAKLLALARDPAATPGEAATARRLAEEICDKFGVQPASVSQGSSGTTRALYGRVSPSWQQYPPPPSSWSPSTHRRDIFRGVPEANLSGISTEDARRMALEILDAAQNGSRYLMPYEEDLVREAFDGLLTEYGKILLVGLHAVAT